MPNFEVFTGRSVPVVKEPRVSLQSRGNFSFNQAAYEAIGSPETIEFLYDPGEKIIGLRAVDPAVPHAYPVRKQANASSYVLAGRAFCLTYGLPVDDGFTRRWVPTVEDGILIVDTKQSPHTSNSARRKK